MEEEVQNQLNTLSEEISIFKDKLKNDHSHNGQDFSRVIWSNVDQKVFYIYFNLYGDSAATASNYGVIFIAPFNCVVTEMKEAHQVAGADAGDVGLQLEKLIDTEAPDSGEELLISDLSIKATANVVQSGNITDDRTNKTLVAGNRLCLKDSGTLTSVQNVSVIISLNML